MKLEKALIVVCALAIAGFLIGVGKYNQHYADAHHPMSVKRAA
jgi:hypothetical protein